MKYIWTLSLCIFLGSMHSGWALHFEDKSNQFGCTCAGLKACEPFACLVSGIGFVCTVSRGRAEAICLCKNEAMNHCDNWDEIINDPHCKDQNDDLLKNNCENCDC